MITLETNHNLKVNEISTVCKLDFQMRIRLHFLHLQVWQNLGLKVGFHVSPPYSKAAKSMVLVSYQIEDQRPIPLQCSLTALPSHSTARTFVYLAGDWSLQKTKGQERGEVGYRSTLLARRNFASKKIVENITERKNAYTAGIFVLHTQLFFSSIIKMDIGCLRRFHIRSREVE